MRIIALIEDPQVIRRILEYVGRWAPQVTQRSPSLGPEAWSAHAGLPLTHHPFLTSPERRARRPALDLACLGTA